MNLVNAKAQLKQMSLDIERAPVDEQLQRASDLNSIDKSVAGSPDVVMFIALRVKQLERTIQITVGS